MCDLLQAEPDKVVLVMRGVVHVLQQLQPHVPHQLLNFDCVLFLYSLEHFLTGSLKLTRRCTMTSMRLGSLFYRPDALMTSPHSAA